MEERSQGKGSRGGIEMDSCGKKFIGRVLNAGDRQEHDEDSEKSSPYAMDSMGVGWGW